jgi:hypothetical protein
MYGFGPTYVRACRIPGVISVRADLEELVRIRDTPLELAVGRHLAWDLLL